MAEMSTSPQDASLLDATGTTRTRSPDNINSNDRKRRRKVLSCYDCRRRKLQCDRAMPACSRCTKAGQASSCLYIDDVADVPPRLSEPSARRDPFEATFTQPIQPGPAGGDSLSRLEYQDRRIKQLEAALEKANHGQESGPAQRNKSGKFPMTPESIHGGDPSSTANDRETMMLRGKSFKTLFLGTTHPGGLIAHIPDLGAFTKDAFDQFPALGRTRTDMRALDDRVNTATAPSGFVDEQQLMALLPPKLELDELIQIYMDNYDTVYHVIHRPSFWASYAELWTNVAAAQSDFVATVLLMTACAYCLTKSQPWLYSADSSAAREKSIAVIQACDEWFLRQSYKHASAASFQIRCLLWLAKQVVTHKFKRQWSEAGSLLRVCMSAGIHRHPDLLRKETSALDKELRRRVWATAVEFELQASFDRGMISAPFLLQSDCPAPRNVHDEDFSTEEMPASRPPTTFTPSSYLSLAEESVMLRSTLNAVLNNIRQTISTQDVRQYTEELEFHLRNIPTWKDPISESPHALLSLKLLQYILVLHERYLHQSNNEIERKFSKITILDAVTRILALHKTLVDKDNFSIQILLPDQMRAALSLAHLSVLIDPLVDSSLAFAFEHTAPPLMDQAVKLMTNKVIRFGREQRQLWICLSARGFMKSRREPENRNVFMQEAVDEITQPYYKIMACQTRMLAQKGKEEIATQELSTLGPGQVMAGPDLANPVLLDLNEIAAWTFEDWTFNPLDFPQPVVEPQTTFAEPDVR